MTIKSLIPRWNRGHVPARPSDEYGLFPLQREINRLFNDFFEESGLEPFEKKFEQSMNLFAPKVDVSETEHEVKLTAELPGLDEKDVEVTLEEDAVIIRGEKKEEKEEKKGDVHRMERTYGSFHRVIPLPAAVKADAAKATFKKGVLTVTLTKKEEAATNRKLIKVTSE